MSGFTGALNEARRLTRAYLGIVALIPKQFLAYRIWVWMEFVVQILAMVIFVYFWRAVYAGRETVGGLELQQTINYILLAQIVLPVIQSRSIFNLGFLIREGQVGVELVRPLDFQARWFVEHIASMVVAVMMKIPLLVLGVLFFGLTLPADPRIWAAFLLALFLGSSVVFFFDWIFGCLAFYSTETWGLSVVREGVAAFFSGSLVPLLMMPGWLQNIAAALPFAQGLAVPVQILTGITPPDAIPQALLVQVAWLVGLLVLSRFIFSIAIRKVTVQGG